MWFWLALILGSCVLAVNSLGCWVSGYQPDQYTLVVPRGIMQREIPIWVDKNFSDKDKGEIRLAVDTWNYVMNGYVELKIVDEGFDMEVDKIKESEKENGWLFMKIDSKSTLVPILNDQRRAVGFANRIGGNHLYLIRDRLWDGEVYGVCLHEIGHLMGSYHVGFGLMSPNYDKDRFSCVDKITMESVAMHFGISPDRLNYCFDSRIKDG
jgi:hypothetical protein